VLVAGAGPAGLTAALHFARRGFRVTVAERRPEPSEADRTTVHTYPMAVNPRAVAAIRAAGAELPLLDPAAHYLGSASAADGRVLFSSAPDAGASEEEARMQRAFLVDQVGLCREVGGAARGA
jgi:kynurenine 3-monooxygenase